MYKHIMVPLDGSELAECVLPHLEMIARELPGFARNHAHSCRYPLETVRRF